jgi:pyridoxal phosphate enzyme (YggS family)
MLGIFVPLSPAARIVGRVQKPLPELGKIADKPVNLRRAEPMGSGNQVTLTSSSPDALAAVEEQIARACTDARRDRASVTLIAVSKTFDADAIMPVIAAGQRVFGENRVQEAKGKWPQLVATQRDIELHLIGPLQSNKAKEAVALFDAIHSVDRPSLCQALAKEVTAQNKHPQLFIQINTGEEPQKAGLAPGDADAFILNCREQYGLTISGLMCIPPVDQAPAPHFALTAKIAARNGLRYLSMGMSADFATAIQFGATHIRVGSAIFGHR